MKRRQSAEESVVVAISRSKNALLAGCFAAPQTETTVEGSSTSIEQSTQKHRRGMRAEIFSACGPFRTSVGTTKLEYIGMEGSPFLAN